MQEYGPFIYSMAPSHRHQTIANYHTTTWSQASSPYTSLWKPYYKIIILEMSARTARSRQRWAEDQLKDLEIWVKDWKAKEYLQQEQTSQVQRTTLDRYLMWRVIDAEHHFVSLESPKDLEAKSNASCNKKCLCQGSRQPFLARWALEDFVVKGKQFHTDLLMYFSEYIFYLKNTHKYELTLKILLINISSTTQLCQIDFLSLLIAE